jgi:predicted transcriptional regulator
LTRVDNFYYYGSLKITVNHYFRKDVVMDTDEQLNKMEIYRHKAIHKIILGCIQEKKSFTETDISIYFSCNNDYQKEEIFKNLNILIDRKFIIEDKNKQMSLTEEGEKYLKS